jgi:hypothetical protein
MVTQLSGSAFQSLIRAATYVTNRHHNTSSVSSIIEDLNWKSLEDRRKIAKLIMMYKLVNGLVLGPMIMNDEHDRDFLYD